MQETTNGQCFAFRRDVGKNTMGLSPSLETGVPSEALIMATHVCTLSIQHTSIWSRSLMTR